MAEVTIKIGPKSYPIRCGEGEEERISELGDLIAQKYALLGNAVTPRESHNLLFTALFMADELSDLRGNAQKAEHEKSRSGGKKAELKAEIETLRKSEERARDEIKQLKADLAELREAQSHQHDLFGSKIDESELAASLEALADRVEATANALEAANVADLSTDTLEQHPDNA